MITVRVSLIIWIGCLRLDALADALDAVVSSRFCGVLGAHLLHWQCRILIGVGFVVDVALQ